MPTPLERSCQEQFGIDFKEKMKEILPFFFQTTLLENSVKSGFVNFAEILFAQINVTNEALVAFCEFVRERLLFSGQVLSLTTFLNNVFDNELRRISIECLNAGFSGRITIFLNGEDNPEPITLFLNSENASSEITLFSNTEINDEASDFGKDFNIQVPADINKNDDVIRAFANIYAIAPQNFGIKRF